MTGLTPAADVGAAAFLSPEALAQLEQETPARLAGVDLTPALAAQIREMGRAMGAQRKADLQARFEVEVQRIEIAEIPVVRVRPREGHTQDRRILYLHGGAFAFGEAHDTGAMLLARRFGVEVLSVEYRLAPEHPFPAGLEDCEDVYRELAWGGGAKGLAVVGMSAGATLAATMLSSAQAEGLDMPDAAILLTPGADMKAIGDSLEANDGRDPVLSWTDQLDKALAAYVGEADPEAPRLSPSRATYAPGYPRSVIVTGTRDVLLSPCVRLYWAMRRGGVEADLRVWDGMWHGFMFSPDLPEAKACLDDIAAFLGWA
ncbi:alpha/beta hydrolase [Phenylobacterium conjunctum]|uniref:Alpha/beta hydrolase n=1 Tax=Phenylobacterium conjunctum TaxID=1298959 RepID=A0ABW3SXR1_9CAUL